MINRQRDSPACQGKNERDSAILRRVWRADPVVSPAQDGSALCTAGPTTPRRRLRTPCAVSNRAEAERLDERHSAGADHVYMLSRIQRRTTMFVATQCGGLPTKSSRHCRHKFDAAFPRGQNEPVRRPLGRPAPDLLSMSSLDRSRRCRRKPGPRNLYVDAIPKRSRHGFGLRGKFAVLF